MLRRLLRPEDRVDWASWDRLLVKLRNRLSRLVLLEHRLRRRGISILRLERGSERAFMEMLVLLPGGLIVRMRGVQEFTIPRLSYVTLEATNRNTY